MVKTKKLKRVGLFAIAFVLIVGCFITNFAMKPAGKAYATADHTMGEAVHTLGENNHIDDWEDGYSHGDGFYSDTNDSRLLWTINYDDAYDGIDVYATGYSNGAVSGKLEIPKYVRLSNSEELIPVVYVVFDFSQCTGITDLVLPADVRFINGGFDTDSGVWGRPAYSNILEEVEPPIDTLNIYVSNYANLEDLFMSQSICHFGYISPGEWTLGCDYDYMVHVLAKKINIYMPSNIYTAAHGADVNNLSSTFDPTQEENWSDVEVNDWGDTAYDLCEQAYWMSKLYNELCAEITSEMKNGKITSIENMAVPSWGAVGGIEYRVLPTNEELYNMFYSVEIPETGVVFDIIIPSAIIGLVALATVMVWKKKEQF